MIILGIDPGTRICGYGILEEKNRQIKCLGYGIINTNPKESLGENLEELQKEIEKLIKEYGPQKIALERLFFFKNLKTAITVAQARGVIILTSTKNKIPFEEFTPLEVKQAVTGYGKADKKGVQKMIKMILDLQEEPKPDDAADALAVAICCANRNKNKII